MKILVQLAVLALAGFTLQSPPSLGAQDTTQATITGQVVDALSGMPIPGALVSLEDLEIERVTDTAGGFVVAGIPIGTYSLILRGEGYLTVSGNLNVQRTGEMVLRMSPLVGPGLSEMSRVAGIVRDAERGEPLEGALVNLDQGNRSQATGSGGRFSFEEVLPGDVLISVEFLGYSPREESVQVDPGTILTMELALAVDPIELDPIEVSVEAREPSLERSGFYGRRRSTSGYFLTRERIEERAPLFTTDLFQGMPGVTVIGGLGMGTQRAVVLTGSRALSFGSGVGDCHPTVWIDDLMVHQGSAGPLGQGPAFLDQLIQPERIAGIEVYNSSSSMPVRYNIYGACGVVVIWTRDGR